MGTPRASAVAAVFVANGLGGPSFLARLPERQADLGVSDFGLGVALVGLAAGALAASPAAGHAVGRVGSRSVVVASSLALGASLWMAGAAPHPALLFAALVVVGAADAAMDVGMNANGAAFEDVIERSLMHRLHGAWSLGALAAALVAAGLAVAGVPLTVHLMAVGAVITALGLATRRHLLDGVTDPLGGEGPSPDQDKAAPAETEVGWRRRPRRWLTPIVMLGMATVAGAVIENAPADWSAIQLERLGVTEGVSALGYAAFMAGMLGGRLIGDRLTDRHGGAQVLRLGMAIGAAGLLVGVAVGHPLVFAAGLVLAGAGASGYFPLAFSAAARTPGVAPGAGAATVSLAARVGFLVEPLLVGGIADLVGLRWAFAMVAVVALGLAAMATRVIPPSTRPGPIPIADLRSP